MSRVLALVRGVPGHPLHPPLTDAAIGAYTVGVAMLVAGALGIEEEQMAHGGLLAVAGGLIVTVPTALTGLLDWWPIPRQSPVRTAATLHLIVMVLATAVFALTFALQLEGYHSDEVTTGAWIAGLGAGSAHRRRLHRRDARLRIPGPRARAGRHAASRGDNSPTRARAGSRAVRPGGRDGAGPRRVNRAISGGTVSSEGTRAYSSSPWTARGPPATVSECDLVRAPGGAPEPGDAVLSFLGDERDLPRVDSHALALGPDRDQLAPKRA